MPRETLKQIGLAWIDIEVAKLHLSLGPGQRCGSLERGRVPVLVDEIEQGGARGRHYGPECGSNYGAGIDAYSSAQSEDRIEHGANRV
jgi:hypothetical protein